MELWVNSVGFALIVPLLILLLNKVYGMKEDVSEAIKIAHQRIDVIDGALGDITDEKFNSKLVVEGHQEIPSTRSIRRVLERAH